DKNIAANNPKKTLVQGMITYGMGKVFRVGANYAKEKSHYRTATADSNQRAYALWGWTKFGGNMGAFGRYENTDYGINTKQKQRRYLIGAEYFPVKLVTLALVFESTKDVGGTLGKKDQKYGLNSEFKY
ncbi:MAG: hypothetical protein Q9M26_03125, partial [Mariprofundales bacterium]|nr:hypothetical protein [Mariprofundales bacterium]